MKAINYARHGEPSVLTLVDNFVKPVLKAGQVLIKVSCASVNPVDCKLRASNTPQFVIPLPKIPGSDFCGVIEEVRDITSKLVVGDRVFGMMPYVWTGSGSCAEYVAVDEKLVAIAPTNASDEELASLPLVGLSVIQSLDSYTKSHTTKNKRILIQAGSGGLGTFAIQYCKHHLEMEVITTCGTKNIEFCRSLGADRVIDYTKEKFEEVLKECDVVFDSKAYMYEERTIKNGVLKKGGHYIHIASSDNLATNNPDSDPLHLAIPEARLDRMAYKHSAYGLYNLLHQLGLSDYTYAYTFVHPDGNGMQLISSLVEKGKIKGVVDTVYNMQDAAGAHTKVEEGHVRGKVVIKML